MICAALEEQFQADRDHQRADQAIHKLNPQQLHRIGGLDPHIPKAWIDPQCAEKQA
ncbi:hypothetical protein Rifp1Sym_bp00090 [endosymbiont of Riftia pachyptila (vent Ph05)]|uniref:Uncharacterized protein n=1 Tax=endosymbiont of Riftia pachyptila (vent Ph05) TaxID=1048808 RepID=G2DDN2_9GAMM|nr:hypothetical protein Rifp1Sym_bp00090 [endosymbiont of Riftia pachyptila (vent Ph05)]